MAKKTFTLEEANQTLEEIRPHVEVIVDINEKIIHTSKDVENLFDIWGDNVMEKNNPDHEIYFELIERGSFLSNELKERVIEVEKIGCYLKDFKLGLVNFPFEHEGKKVFLSWKLGEKSIDYWHEMNSGFSGRKRIDELNKPISQ
ncbi:MAG: DUF2203 domain-containing protein [Candidatus Aenigmatarchaeota archaeon]|nr:DUF2203 domain-containing protein [Nanoarchaeota archaeon]